MSSNSVFLLLVVLGILAIASSILRILRDKKSNGINGTAQLINDFKQGNYVRGFAMIATIVAYVILVQLFGK